MFEVEDTDSKKITAAWRVRQVAMKTSAGRFKLRIQEHFVDKGKSVWLHHFWWVVHNAVAHPLIAVLPVAMWTFKFHDYTSDKINGKK